MVTFNYKHAGMTPLTSFLESSSEEFSHITLVLQLLTLNTQFFCLERSYHKHNLSKQDLFFHLILKLPIFVLRYVRMRGKEMFVFRKIWRDLFSSNTLFEIYPSALLLPIYSFNYSLAQQIHNSFLVQYCYFYRLKLSAKLVQQLLKVFSMQHSDYGHSCTNIETILTGKSEAK